jgi:hypothetical protein
LIEALIKCHYVICSKNVGKVDISKINFTLRHIEGGRGGDVEHYLVVCLGGNIQHF